MITKTGKTNIKYLLIVAILAAIIGGGILYCYSNLPEYKVVSIEFPPKTEKKVEDETADWQIYRNEEYGFEFSYPAIPPECESCKIYESDEGFHVNTASFNIENSGSLTLSEFVANKMEGFEIGEEKEIIIGDEEGIEVDYRFGGMGRFGNAAFIKRGDNIFVFNFTAGTFCCSSNVDIIYEVEVYTAMLSTFRFLE